MAYISSNNNRWYCQLEGSYGQVPAITAQNRMPAVTMSVQQKVEAPRRKDKTGTRTYAGAPTTMRKQTQFDLTTYMTSWINAGTSPAYGPLFQAALGGSTPYFYMGGTALANSTALEIFFASAHGLTIGQAIAFGGEIRFVTSTPDHSTAIVNCPFSTPPAAGTPIGATITFLPSTELSSVSIFDYWDPSTAVQRLLCGCAVNQLDIDFNGDYQEFSFKGMAQDVLDTSSFTSGQGQLNTYPPEPTVVANPPTLVPGHLGEAWLGQSSSRFYTLTALKMSLSNSLDMRAREFGTTLPRAINPGARSVTLDMDLYGQDDPATVALYTAARQRTPISAGFQLGQTSGQLMGLYMKSIVPEVPQYNDKENRLQWQFKGSQAQGVVDDELSVAFG